MSEWWDNLNVLTQIFYFFAIPSTVILVIQSVLTLIGVSMNADGDMDFDTEMDVDTDVSFDTDDGISISFDDDSVDDFENFATAADFRFITFRGIIAFLTMFGWVGAGLSTTTMPIVLIVLIAFIAGLGSMFLIAMLFYGISKLQSSGNINYRLAIGKEAIVYIPIPANKEGTGKIQLTLQERLLEVSAVTEEATMLPTNSNVRIIDMLNATTYVVERI